MIINIFKNSQPASLVIIPVFMVAMWLLGWQTGGGLIVQNPMPLYNLVLWMMESAPAWFPGLIGFLLTTAQVFYLNHIIIKHEVLFKNSYLPALFYMLFLTFIPQFLSFNPVIITNTFLLLALDKIFRLYKSTNPLPLVFDTCFLIGVATLFYLPAISFFLLFAISILILKTFSWRDWMVGIVGLLLPFFFAFVYYFWYDGLDELKEKFFLNNIRQLIDTGGLALQGYRITLVVITLITILAIIRIRQNFYKNATRIRNYQQVIFMFMLVALLSLAFAGSVAVYRFSIVTIPLGTMISYYFLAAKKAWISEVIFWLLIATMAVNYVSVYS
ncbi:MAG: hypothetical protein KBH11_04110 [Bacteroidia bacterium]|nr:hypothetical protein [Bacteroidota bacterium]MBP9082235.1 hypothetical protein [Bacteroidia bacterium]MBK7387554.1 hypothetical protein [Bacteroidota bacterium]MBK7971323.1 hypothetical protein [Bacteroidota bacterium]MBK8415113.1 hypothetical protein [Bacteroidota bacterium]